MASLTSPRYVLAALFLLVIAGLMYAGTIDSAVGVSIIVGLAAGLGLYEGGRKVQAALNRGR